MKEQIIRQVTRIGNGAHIFAPKEWLGEEVVLVRTPEKSLIEKIFSVISPHLENIKGVYLYGSRARGEEEKDSDIDLFIITSKKIKIKEKRFEIISVEEDKIDRVIKSFPLVMYSILSEAKPIINSNLIEELKNKYKPKLENFRGFLNETKNIIKINEEFLNLNKNKVYTDSSAEAYSIILRLRGIFLIKKIIHNEKYYHKEFNNWIKSKLPDINYTEIYSAYKFVKLNNRRKIKLKIGNLKSLLNLLKKETDLLSKQLTNQHGEKKKTA